MNAMIGTLILSFVGLVALVIVLVVIVYLAGFVQWRRREERLDRESKERWRRRWNR